LRAEVVLTVGLDDRVSTEPIPPPAVNAHTAYEESRPLAALDAEFAPLAELRHEAALL